MRTLPTLFILAAVLLIAGFASPSLAERQHQTTVHKPVHEQHPDVTGSIPCTHPSHEHDGESRHHDHDHVALADMHTHATHHLAGAHSLPATFGAAPLWARDWELRWIDYDTGHGHVRIYHATYKHDHGIRYTSLGHSATRDHAWNPAH